MEWQFFFKTYSRINACQPAVLNLWENQRGSAMYFLLILNTFLGVNTNLGRWEAPEGELNPPTLLTNQALSTGHKMLSLAAVGPHIGYWICGFVSHYISEQQYDWINAILLSRWRYRRNQFVWRKFCRRKYDHQELHWNAWDGQCRLLAYTSDGIVLLSQ